MCFHPWRSCLLIKKKLRKRVDKKSRHWMISFTDRLHVYQVPPFMTDNVTNHSFVLQSPTFIQTSGPIERKASLVDNNLCCIIDCKLYESHITRNKLNCKEIPSIAGPVHIFASLLRIKQLFLLIKFHLRCLEWY